MGKNLIFGANLIFFLSGIYMHTNSQREENKAQTDVVYMEKTQCETVAATREDSRPPARETLLQTVEMNSSERLERRISSDEPKIGQEFGVEEFGKEAILGEQTLISEWEQSEDYEALLNQWAGKYQLTLEERDQLFEAMLDYDNEKMTAELALWDEGADYETIDSLNSERDQEFEAWLQEALEENI